MIAASRTATWALLLALPWLEGCGGRECNASGSANTGNFQVTLWVAQPPLPDDLSLVLTSEYYGDVIRTLPEIVSDTAHSPKCWLGARTDKPNSHYYKDPAGPPTDRISCAWGGDMGDTTTGSFEATAAGYQDVALFLVAMGHECEECSCPPPTPGRAEAELKPL